MSPRSGGAPSRAPSEHSWLESRIELAASQARSPPSNSHPRPPPLPLIHTLLLLPSLSFKPSSSSPPSHTHSPPLAASQSRSGRSDGEGDGGAGAGAAAGAAAGSAYSPPLRSLLKKKEREASTRSPSISPAHPLVHHRILVLPFGSGSFLTASGCFLLLLDGVRLLPIAFYVQAHRPSRRSAPLLGPNRQEYPSPPLSPIAGHLRLLEIA